MTAKVTATWIISITPLYEIPITVVTVPGTWFGHSKHLLNAESKYHFPLSNQYSIVFFKDFYFKVFINTFYMFIYCTFHHLLVTFLMFTFSFKSTASTAIYILMTPVIQVFHISMKNIWEGKRGGLWGSQSIWSQPRRAQISPAPPACCLTLDKWLNLIKPQSPHL